MDWDIYLERTYFFLATVLSFSGIDDLLVWFADHSTQIVLLYVFVTGAKFMYQMTDIAGGKKLQTYEDIGNFVIKEIVWFAVIVVCLWPTEGALSIKSQSGLVTQSAEQTVKEEGFEGEYAIYLTVENKEIPLIAYISYSLSAIMLSVGDYLAEEFVMKDVELSYIKNSVNVLKKLKKPLVKIMTKVPVWGEVIHSSIYAAKTRREEAPKSMMTMPISLAMKSDLEAKVDATKEVLQQTAENIKANVENASVDTRKRVNAELKEKAEKEPFFVKWGGKLASFFLSSPEDVNAVKDTLRNIGNNLTNFNIDDWSAITTTEGASSLGIIWKDFYTVLTLIGVYYAQLVLMVLSMAVFPFLLIVIIPAIVFGDRGRHLFTMASIKMIVMQLWPLALVVAFLVGRAGLFIWSDFVRPVVSSFIVSAEDIKSGEDLSVVSGVIVGVGLAFLIWTTISSLLRTADDMLRYIFEVQIYRAGGGE